VRGFAILSGRILPEISPRLASPAALMDLNAFVSHGIEDGTLPLHFGRDSRQWLQDRQVPLAYQEYPAGHELNESMQRDFGEWMDRQIYAA
jgi:phospholipase/carboxylesterase